MMNLESPRILSGFYTCPECGKLHTFTTPSFTGMVECACGAIIDQWERGGAR